MTKSSRSVAFARWLIVIFVAFDVAFLWQKATGVYDSEFGAHPDEAAHYVTGLFVHDALATLPKCAAERSLKPLAPFKGKEAKDGFYAHYPKVALGVWPPAFYVVQSAWTFPFGTSRTSILVLMAVLAALTAALLHRALRTEFGDGVATGATLLWLCGPLVRETYGVVMAEMLSTLAMFGATLAWGRFMDDRRTRDAVVFGLLAALAILTKGTGMALVFMCALSIGFTRRWNLLATRGTWIGASIVALLAGPWTWIFRGEGTRVGGWADNSGGLSAAFSQKAIFYYAEVLGIAVTLAVVAFAVAGFVVRVMANHPRQGRWAALGSLVLGVFVFQCLIPVGLEARHIVSTTPALIMLAVAGAHGIANLRRLRAEGAEQQRREKLWVVLLMLLALPSLAWPIYISGIEKKGFTGFRDVALEVLDKSKPGGRILVSSDASGEGMFISELAMRDGRPNLFVERASTALVDQSSKKWDGRNQRSKFLDDDSLYAYLTSGEIQFIVLDDAVPENKRADYHDQLRRVIQDHVGTNFWPSYESPVMRDNELLLPPIRLYVVRTGLGN